jgi:phosphate transport system substrate-binding protein
MKKLPVCLILTLLIISLLLNLTSCNNKTPSEEGIEGTITISGAWALYPMVVKWGEEFQKIHPKVMLDISAGGAGKGMADALAGVVDLGMVSRDIYPAEVEKGAWWISVTKDAVVPTVNENNPAITEILSKGVTKQSLIDIWITGKITDWGEIFSEKSGHAIHVFTRSDACGAAKTWAKFLDKNQEDLQGIGVYGDPGLAEAVVQDVSGIGYNNINYVYDNQTKSPVKGIRILPIDLNNNGRIDESEDFYDNRDQIVEAIKEGKYPSPPARDLHLVSKSRPNRKVVTEFLKWILTDGQKYVPEAGYINFSEQRLQMELTKLETVNQ